MPFAALGYPHHNADAFAAQYPADFICEAIDQTRGWFYTLMAVGTLVFGESSYRNVVCLGHILDEDGRKMSKHLGNILAPIPLMDEHGADALRWFMLASGSPWQARRVGHAAIADVVRKTLLTYWNTVSFQSLYARTAGWQPADGAPAPADRPVIDRWVLSEAQLLARGVDEALEAFDTQRAGRLLSAFVDDLSNWYVRRSRRRFWEGDPAALATLHEALRVVTLCLAPFTPFITERVWQDLFRATDPSAPASVHLASWPESGPGAGRPLARRADGPRATARRARPRGPGLVLGPHAAAAATGAHLGSPAGRACPDDLRQQVAEELNVQSLEALADESAGLVDVSVKANFRSLGQRFGKQTPVVAAAVADAPAADVVRALRESGGRAPVARATSATSRSPTTTSSSPRPRRRAGRSSPRVARAWPSTCTSTTSCAARAWRARSSAPCRRAARRPGSTSPIASRVVVSRRRRPAGGHRRARRHDRRRGARDVRSPRGPPAGEAVAVETDLPARLWLARA